MILYIMLVALGFLIATLLALALAPAFWRRAERLTTQRIEQSMPMSIAETEADRDQLRASYAIIIRRLEAALSQEKMRSARQLVKISRLQMEIANLNDRTAQLNSQLEAEHNAASVLRRTIATRVPELNRAASDARQLVHVRDSEINSVVNRLRHREEALAIAQRTTEMQQAEIARLRQAMEMSGAQNAGRFKLRPTQWSIHDYRAEYDRLNVELSKLRERLQVAYDREANQVTQLRTELQQLADQIVTAAETLPEGERQRALTDERAESETGEARGTGADSQEMEAVMRSIDAIIADESASTATPPARTGSAVPAYTDQAPKRAGRSRAAVSPRRLALGAMATASGLAEATRSAVANAISGTTENDGGEVAAPKPGRVSAAKLLGGAAVQEDGKQPKTPQPKTPTARADVDGTGGAKPDTGEPPAAESTEAAAPVSQSPAPDRASETIATQSQDGASAKDVTERAATADDQPAAEAGKPDDSGGSLYDQFRTAKPTSGKLMDDTADAAAASRAKDDTDTAAASPARDTPEAAGAGNGASQGADEDVDRADETKGDAESGGEQSDSSASSLLDRLKQVPENQTQ